MSDVVALDSVTRRYGAVTALEDASLTLRPGEAVALVGHNGAGKTTLMKLVLGLVRPGTGSVRVLGEDPAGPHGAAVRRRVGFLPESVAFHGAMTGAELLGFYARLKGAGRAAVMPLLERVGIAAAAHRRVGTYSKGMAQRLGLAQALIGEPGLLLLDEPTSGLDPESRLQVYDTVDELRRRGATVLLSTHVLPEIERHADRVALIHRGRLLATAPIGELRRMASLPMTARLTVQPCTTERARLLVAGYTDVVAREPQSLVLALDPADKMRLFRDLQQLGPALEDLEVEMPGLEAVYHHLVAREEGAR